MLNKLGLTKLGLLLSGFLLEVGGKSLLLKITYTLDMDRTQRTRAEIDLGANFLRTTFTALEDVLQVSEGGKPSTLYSYGAYGLQQ